MASLTQILFVPPPPLVWAEAKGFLAARGVSLANTQTRSSDEVRDGIVGGTFDVAIAAVDNFLAWQLESGAELPMLAQMDGSTILKLMAAPRFKTIAGLADAVISVDALTNGFALVLFRMLAQAGLKRESLNFVQTGGVKHRFDALIEGKVDATILVPPFDDIAQGKGFTCLGDGKDFVPDYPGVVLGVRRDRLAANRPAIVAYVAGLIAANRWGTDPANRHEARDLLIASGRAPDSADATIATQPRDLAVSVPGWNIVVDLRRTSGLLGDNPPSGAQMIEDGPRQDALALLG
jgi:ABC-type nitrate/sulfonate/bicarbonate transport system substrate-binding protein